MIRDPDYSPFGPMPAPRVPRVGELLFEFLLGHERIRCELRDHGEYGVEAMFLRNDEFNIGRICHQRLDSARTPHARFLNLRSDKRATDVVCER